MERGKITSFQLFCLIALFIFGSTSLLQSITVAGRDSWISHIIAIFAGVFMGLIITSLAVRFPNQTIIQYTQELFGSIVGKIIGIMYLWYFLHLGALVLRNYGEFLSNMVLPETPMWFINLTFALVVAYMAAKGIEVIARVGELFWPIIAILTIITSILISISGHKEIASHLNPVLEHGLTKVILGAVPIASFPFLEIILFSMFFPFVNIIGKSKNATLAGILFSGLLLTMILVQNIAVFGDYLATLTFPRYFIVRIISVGGFVERIEPLVLAVWLMAGLIKIGICLYAFTLGLSQITGMKNDKVLIIPTAVLMVVLSLLIYDNTFELLNFAVNIYPVYAFPFQVGLPMLMLVIAVVRGKGGKKIKECP